MQQAAAYPDLKPISWRSSTGFRIAADALRKLGCRRANSKPDQLATDMRQTRAKCCSNSRFDQPVHQVPHARLKMRQIGEQGVDGARWLLGVEAKVSTASSDLAFATALDLFAWTPLRAGARDERRRCPSDRRFQRSKRSSDRN